MKSWCYLGLLWMIAGASGFAADHDEGSGRTRYTAEASSSDDESDGDEARQENEPGDGYDFSYSRKEPERKQPRPDPELEARQSQELDAIAEKLAPYDPKRVERNFGSPTGGQGLVSRDEKLSRALDEVDAAQKRLDDLRIALRQNGSADQQKKFRKVEAQLEAARGGLLAAVEKHNKQLSGDAWAKKQITEQGAEKVKRLKELQRLNPKLAEAELGKMSNGQMFRLANLLQLDKINRRGEKLTPEELEALAGIHTADGSKILAKMGKRMARNATTASDSFGTISPDRRTDKQLLASQIAVLREELIQKRMKDKNLSELSATRDVDNWLATHIRDSLGDRPPSSLYKDLEAVGSGLQRYDGRSTGAIRIPSSPGGSPPRPGK